MGFAAQQFALDRVPGHVGLGKAVADQALTKGVDMQIGRKSRFWGHPGAWCLEALWNISPIGKVRLDSAKQDRHTTLQEHMRPVQSLELREVTRGIPGFGNSTGSMWACGHLASASAALPGTDVVRRPQCRQGETLAVGTGKSESAFRWVHVEFVPGS